MPSKTLRAKQKNGPMLEALEDRQLLDAGGITPLAPLTPFASLADFDKYFLDRAVTQYASLFGQALSLPAQSPNILSLAPYIFLAPQLRGPITSPSSDPQTPGVDEGDIVQSDAAHLYVLSQNQIVILDKLPGGGLRIESRINVPANPITLFLDGAHLTVISQVYTGVFEPAASITNPGDPVPGLKPRLEVSVFDVSNTSAPDRIQDTVMDGTFVAARAVGDHLYLVARNDNASLPAPQIITNSDGTRSYETQAAYVARVEPQIANLVLPQFYQSGLSTPNPDPIGPINAPTEVYQPRSDSDTTFNSIVTFDMSATGTGVTDVQTEIGGYVTAVYATTNHIYLVSSDFSPSYAYQADGSIIQRFDVQGAGLVPGPAGFVPTLVQSQFGLDEQNGFLRVVGSSPYLGGALPFVADDAAVSLFVLSQDGMNLKVVGSLEHLDMGNQLTASRFFGAEQFLATTPVQFSAPAPGSLQVINLSDPTNPSAAGQVQMAGEVNYLQMLDATHLLGLGLNSGIELSLFDVADANHPGLIDQAHVALADSSDSGFIFGPSPQSLAYSATQGLLAIPSVGTWTSPGHEVSSADFLYQVDLQTGFHLVGTIAHDSQAERNVLEGNELYSIADASVVAQQLVETTTPGEPSTFSFGTSQEVRLSDNPRGFQLPSIEAGTDHQFLGSVLNFKVSDPAGLIALIAWGDGTTTNASIAPGDDGRFSVVGQHTYAADGQYTITITFSRNGVDAGLEYTSIRVGQIDSQIENFLRRLYQNLLLRGIDQGALDSWSTNLINGVTRSFVAQSVLQSGEYQTMQIRWYYSEMLNRAVEDQALGFWLQYLAAGHSLDDVRANILNSPEFFANAGSSAGFVSQLYVNLLGRQADQLGQLAWQNALQFGMPREQVVYMIAHSPEATMRDVTEYYQRILNRAADTQGLLYYAAALQVGNSSESAEAAIFGSNEYLWAH